MGTAFKLRKRKKKLPSRDRFVLLTEDVKEMYPNLYRKCGAIVLLIETMDLLLKDSLNGV